jgi:hypothetical protein
MKHILIAGGSGLIGNRLALRLIENGYEVSILSRNPKGSNHYFWNPAKKEIDASILGKVDVIINLSGAGIADKKWTHERKLELQNSRVGTNVFLYSLVDQLPNLNHFICASGINAYGYNDAKIYTETDEYGSDFLSQLVRVWELSAEQFNTKCKVANIRTAMVLSSKGGALGRLLPVIKFGLGSGIGKGTQPSPWIHIDDLVEMYVFTVEKELEGSYNAVAGCDSNYDLMKTLAQTLRKPYWLPNVPGFVMRRLFGEMALMLLNGVRSSNEKITNAGFVFKFTNLKDALRNLLKK